MDVGSGIQKHLFVGEQGGASSGVKEKDFFIFGESAFADVIDQACHSFSGIDRIEQDSFGFRQEMNGFQGSFVGNPVSFSDVSIIRIHPIDIDVRNPEFVCGFADQAMDRLNLLLPRIADTDAKHRQACMDSFQPCHQSGLGSGASGGMNQTVENQRLLVDLGI